MQCLKSLNSCEGINFHTLKIALNMGWGGRGRGRGRERKREREGERERERVESGEIAMVFPSTRSGIGILNPTL